MGHQEYILFDITKSLAKIDEDYLFYSKLQKVLRAVATMILN